MPVESREQRRQCQVQFKGYKKGGRGNKRRLAKEEGGLQHCGSSLM